MKNRLKSEIEQEEVLKVPQEVTAEVSEPVVTPRKASRVGRTVTSVVSGRFLISESTLKHVPFLFFLAFLGLLYIANGYFAQSKDRQLEMLTSQISDLNTQYQVAKAKLMYISKESEVAKAATGMGLKEPVVPPGKIVVNTNPIHP